MFAPIHRALGLDPGEVTLDLISAAIEHRVEESADLDWKTGLYDTRKPSWQDEAAKDIAAMANSGGGWIVFGVVEDGEANAASAMNAIAWNADAQQRILRCAYARVGPPVLGIEFFPMEVDEGRVVLMRIPDSVDAPHFARKGDDAFVAPRRNGPHTVFMSDREIERSFRERFQRSDDRERRLQDLFEDAGRALSPEQGVALVLAALPAEPSPSNASLTEAEARGIFDQPTLSELVYPGSRGLKTWDSSRVRKGLRRWLQRNEDRESHAFRKSVHDGGTVLAAYRLGGLTDREQAAPYYPVGKPNHCMSADVESALIDFISTLRAHATNRQLNGGYLVRAGLIGNQDEPIFIRTTENNTNYLLDADYMEPIPHFQAVRVHLDPLEPVSEMLEVINDMARDLIACAGNDPQKEICELDNLRGLYRILELNRPMTCAEDRPPG